jgi:hypothetical protein
MVVAAGGRSEPEPEPEPEDKNTKMPQPGGRYILDGGQLIGKGPKNKNKESCRCLVLGGCSLGSELASPRNGHIQNPKKATTAGDDW